MCGRMKEESVLGEGWVWVGAWDVRGKEGEERGGVEVRKRSARLREGCDRVRKWVVRVNKGFGVAKRVRGKKKDVN